VWFPPLTYPYRVQEPKRRSIQHPSDIELLLRDYQRAREETKSEIARARDKLRERAEQEKRRIREQIFSQLQKVSVTEETIMPYSHQGIFLKETFPWLSNSPV